MNENLLKTNIDADEGDWLRILCTKAEYFL